MPIDPTLLAAITELLRDLPADTKVIIIDSVSHEDWREHLAMLPKASDNADLAAIRREQRRASQQRTRGPWTQRRRHQKL